jgi:hypothetical protein
MGKCGEKFSEKVYYKFIFDKNNNTTNGNFEFVNTTPKSISYIRTTKETDKTFKKEYPLRTYFINVLEIKKSKLNNSEPVRFKKVSINETDTNSYLTFESINNEGTIFTPDSTEDCTVTGATGRFLGATKAKVIYSTDKTNPLIKYREVIVTGYRPKC